MPAESGDGGYPCCLKEDVVMKMEDITTMGTVGWQEQILCKASVQDNQRNHQADDMDDALDHETMPTPQPVI